ncbi:MAG: amino acid transporter substrate-binding protein [Defluviitaleaceae bacterium]|jgi:L-cystine transport system substrate-binding protein|nr:amino acid transporter substrate-binding protein [Defluviitaleaceae bacterium]
MSLLRKIIVLSMVLALSAASVACSKSNPTSSDSSSALLNTATSDSSEEVTEIRVAHTQTYVPYDYVNDQGESDGFEVQVLKAVDELLPQYKFTFVPTSDDDLLIGVESGKYQVGVKGAWFTEERAKKYIYPKNYIAASIIGLTFRAEDSDKIKDMESFARFSGKLVPIAPQSAQWNIVEEYNKTHPDNQVNLVASENFNISDAYTWVLEGRYDAYFDIKLSYENNVLADNAPYKDLANKLAYVPYKAIPTYPLFNKNVQDLADAYDKAIEQLTKEGKIAELSQKYFNEDIFQYISE